MLPSGRKRYVVQYRAGRRSRRISLGPSTVLTCEQARSRAMTIISAARNGEDPAAERDAGRKAITVKELAERFDREHIAIRVKASTAKEYRRNLERFILPALGQLTVTGITRADVAKFHHDLRHIPYQANRCLEVVSKMFSLAEMWGLRPDGTNPRKHIRKYPEEKRERFLSAAELRRIGEVLREMEAEGIELPSAILAARLLILTGCRLNEIMTLKWAYVDLAERVLRLPDSKSGAKVVHLGQPAVDLLRDAQRIDGNPWVIAGTLPGKRAERSPALLAARPRPRRSEGRPHPRPAPHLRVDGRRLGSGPADDRQAARPHAGPDHGALRPPRRRAGADGGGCGGAEPAAILGIIAPTRSFSIDRAVPRAYGLRKPRNWTRTIRVRAGPGGSATWTGTRPDYAGGSSSASSSSSSACSGRGTSIAST